MKSVVDLLLGASEYNGHLQTELTKAKYSDLVKIMIEIESRFHDKVCELRVSVDGGGSIYIVNFWEKGENGVHVDRLVVSIAEIDFSEQNASY